MEVLGLIYLYWAGWLAELTCFLMVVELVLVLVVIRILREARRK